MKKISFFLIAAVLLFTFVSCSGSNDASSSVPTVQYTPIEENYTIDDDEGLYVTSLKSNDGIPPLNDDLRYLYNRALEVYENIVLGNFKVTAEDMKKDGNVYSRVLDDRFKTYDEFTAYLDSLFTEDFIKNTINKKYGDNFIKGKNDQLYVLTDLREKNEAYCGHVFEITSHDDENIYFTATVYNSKKNESGNYLYTGDKFYIEPTNNISNFNTKTCYYQLVNTSDGWLFDKFELFY